MAVPGDDRRRRVSRPKVWPFTVVVDGNEVTGSHRGYCFELITPHPAVVAGNLRPYAADYSILGHEGRVGLERKSKADLYGTVGRNFDDGHFDARLAVLGRAAVAAVVVEADFLDCVVNPPPYSKTHPASLRGQVLAWMFRHPVRWIFMSHPDAAQVVTFRVLERYWYDHVDR